MTGTPTMTIQFRSGETKALGIIEKVPYEKTGNHVIDTYEDGPMNGVSVRYSMTGPDTARTELGALRRLK